MESPQCPLRPTSATCHCPDIFGLLVISGTGDEFVIFIAGVREGCGLSRTILRTHSILIYVLQCGTWLVSTLWRAVGFIKFEIDAKIEIHS
jgi:hypothetical protein